MIESKIDLTNDYAKIKHRKQTRVFYINVEGMSPMKALSYVKNIKSQMIDDGLDEIYYENFFLPVQEPNRIEVFQ
jgi:hypothetical protein